MPQGAAPMSDPFKSPLVRCRYLNESFRGGVGGWPRRRKNTGPRHNVNLSAATAAKWPETGRRGRQTSTGPKNIQGTGKEPTFLC